MKIAVRLGHQSTGLDIASPGEFEITRQYGPYVISGLKRLGYDVLDVTPPEANRTLADSLNYGINKANDWGADYFISLHANSYNKLANGCEVVYYPSSSKGKEIATNICNEVTKLGFYNRGPKSDIRGLAELKRTNMTAVIIEPLFVDNTGDMSIFNPERVGYAIVKGITGQDIKATQSNDAGYRVITGVFSNKNEATDFANKLKSQGTTAYVVDVNILK